MKDLELSDAKLVRPKGSEFLFKLLPKVLSLHLVDSCTQNCLSSLEVSVV